MEPQTPAKGIMLDTDFGDSKFYTVSCDCGSPDDQIRFEVEADEHNVTVHIWTTVKTNWFDEQWRRRYDIENSILQSWHWWALDLANGFWRRCKKTWQLWTKGYLEYESWTLMNRQQTLNFAETLKTAIDDVTEFRKAKNDKQ